MVKKYRELDNPPKNEKELKVLDIVRQFPLYSLDKLVELIPEMSRHSIQLFLEKYNLSTVEKRLAFAKVDETENIDLISKIKNLLLMVSGALKSLKRNNQSAIKPEHTFHFSAKLIGLIILLAISWKGSSLIFSEPPAIMLEQPEMNIVHEGEKLYVSGKVIPRVGKVLVNGQNLVVNGDGSFTGVVDIPIGESTLEVIAKRFGKTAQLVRLVKRNPTPEELAKIKEEEMAKKRELIDRLAERENTVNNLLSVRNDLASKKGSLRILNNHLKVEGGFSNIEGEVVNLGEEDASWVMITANFLNESGAVVETKYGFATEYGEVLNPKEKINFETQATTKAFDHYSLELSWGADSQVAGVSAEEAQDKTSTTSAKSKKPQ